MTERIGFIGLGVMGRPMAAHLQRRGWSLSVHTRTRAAAQALLAGGAAWAGSPADVASQSDIIITMVPDTPDVQAVIAGREGVLEGLRPGSLVVDMSSVSPVATRALAALVASRGGTMLDAPVSGGEIGAIDGTLSIMVGGDPDAFARARPVFACMGHPDRIVHVGSEPGSGQVCKVCNQIAIAGALAGVGEALALATKAGVDASAVRRALRGGFASSRVLDVHGERILNGNYAPGFRTALYQKDLRLALETAAALGVPIPAAALVSELVDTLVASGEAGLDYSAVGRVIADKAGVSRRSD